MHSRTEVEIFTAAQILQMDIYTYTFGQGTSPDQDKLSWGRFPYVSPATVQKQKAAQKAAAGVEETSGPAQTTQVHQGPAYTARTLSGQQHQVPLCTSGWIQMNEMNKFTFLLVFTYLFCTNSWKPAYFEWVTNKKCTKCKLWFESV